MSKNKLPKESKIGDIIEKEIKVRNRKRVLTFECVNPHGKNKNLNWKVRKNESPEQNKARKEKEIKKERKNKL